MAIEYKEEYKLYRASVLAKMLKISVAEAKKLKAGKSVQASSPAATTKSKEASNGRTESIN